MIAVIADDLTGAAELGAAARRRGLRAEIVLAGEPTQGVEVACLDTDSRLCAPGEAARRAAAAARMIRQRGAERIYKKTDSLLRGNVTAEIEAIVVELGLTGALLVPANPSLGRTIQNGQYRVNGRLIHQTEFAEDPQYPRRSPFILDLLERPQQLPLAIGHPALPLPPNGVVVGEASNVEDLRQWAAVAPPGWLLAGGVEFFAALLPATAAVPNQTPLAAGRDGPQLFVCGSTSEATRRFVGLQAGRGVPVFGLPPGVAETGTLTDAEFASLKSHIAAALGAHARVVLQVGLPRVRSAPIAQGLALCLVRVAAAVLEERPVRGVFAEGGATAVALARALGWHRLGVLGELAMGVAVLSPTPQSSQTLTIKPGSYTWPETVMAGGE